MTLNGIHKFTLHGNYANNSIDLILERSREKINTVSIFIHGLYGVFDENDKGCKAYMLGDLLIHHNISHIIYYNSSRDYTFAKNTNFEFREMAFKNKTFQQELEDLITVVTYITSNCLELFDIQKNDLVLNLHGSSLGGTLAILLMDFFPYIKKISLCGSGCGNYDSKKPILSTMFPENWILNSVKNYTGKLLLLQGDKDTVVPKESGLRIIANATKAETKVVVSPGVNHNFTMLNGVESQEAKNIFATTIFDFFSKP